MKKLTPLSETKSRSGVAALLYIQKDLAEAIKILGGGKMSRGIRHILDTYSKEIYAAASKSKEDMRTLH